MTPATRQMYNMAKDDKEFCDAMRATQCNYVPGYFSDDIEKCVFAAMYGGYLLHKLGIEGYNAMRVGLQAATVSG